MTLETNLLERFPACYRTLGDTLFRRLAVSVEPGLAPEGFADFLAVKSLEFDLPPYIAQLAELELAYYQVRYAPESLPEKPDRLLLNPSLRLVPLAWRNVTPLLFPLQEHAEPLSRARNSCSSGVTPLNVALESKSRTVMIYWC